MKAGLRFSSSLALRWGISAEETWIKSFRVQGASQLVCLCLLSLGLCKCVSVFAVDIRGRGVFFKNGLEDKEGSFFNLRAEFTKASLQWTSLWGCLLRNVERFLVYPGDFVQPVCTSGVFKLYKFILLFALCTFFTEQVCVLASYVGTSVCMTVWIMNDHV